MRFPRPVHIAAALTLLIVFVMASTLADAGGRKPRRTPRLTPVPTPVVAKSPIPMFRDEVYCARVLASGPFVSAKSAADAIARGAAVIDSIGPCTDDTTPRATPTPTPRPPTPTPASATTHTWTDDPSLTWRWMEGHEFSCEFDGAACWGMLVTAAAGCASNLYVELSVMDSQEVVVGFTNDTAGALAPGQTARLVFESFESGARQARPTEMTCY